MSSPVSRRHVLISLAAVTVAPWARAQSVARQAGAHRRAVRRGRHHRHHCARAGAGDAARVRAALRGRQQARRRRQQRSGRSGQVGARRLHAADGHGGHACHQPGAVSEDAVRPREGLCADHVVRRRAQRAGGEPGCCAEVSDQLGARPHSRSESQPRQAQLRQLGQRHVDPPVGGAVQVDDRHLHGPSAVPRLRSGIDRPARWQRRPDVRQPAAVHCLTSRPAS